MSGVEFEVSVPGGVIAGEDYGGTGPDVILVHGLGYSVEMWRALGPILSRHARVIAFDLRGHGQSTCAADEPIELLHDFSRVVDATGMRRPILVGHQYGGLVAAYVAAVAPDLPGAVCLIDSPATEPASTVEEILRLFESEEVLRDLFERFAFGRSGRGLESLETFFDEVSQKYAEDWLITTTSPAVAREGAQRATLVRNDGTWTRQPTLEACREFARFPQVFGVTPGREMLEGLPVPVWSLQPAEGDFAGSYESFAQLARQRPGWAARLLPGDLHLPQANPALIAAELTDLLATLQPHPPCRVVA